MLPSLKLVCIILGLVFFAMGFVNTGKYGWLCGGLFFWMLVDTLLKGG